IAENGAISFVRAPAQPGTTTARIVALDGSDPAERARRIASLRALASELCQRFPGVTLADDNLTRRTDVTLDIGEHHQLDATTVAALIAAAEEAGARTFTSSIHLHLTHESAD